MKRSKLNAVFLATSIALMAFSANASDNPGAHQHGHAELQVAVDGNQIDLIFTSPAYNLLGFEHRARTDDQKALVKETEEWLERTPLINTPDASCKVASAEVYHEDGDGSGDHHEHNEHEHSEGYGHSDFEVTQVLNCTGLASAEALLIPLTERFPEIEDLGVQWVWSGGQGSTRLEQPESSFSLKGQ